MGRARRRCAAHPDGSAQPRGDRRRAAPSHPLAHPSATSSRTAADRRGRTRHEAGGAGMTTLLDAREITVRFGGVTANDRVSIEVYEGERLGIIGPNGAGKTTFIDAITGFVPSSGQVTLCGHDVTDASAAARVRTGMTRTWQSVELFDDLTIVENLDVAAHRSRRSDLLREIIGIRPKPDRER